MVAQGRLGMPAHPRGDFFANFYMVADPVYMPIYSPGTALVHAPGAVLGVPPWCTSLWLSGLAVGLMVTMWPGINSEVKDEFLDFLELMVLDRWQSEEIFGPALIFFSRRRWFGRCRAGV